MNARPHFQIARTDDATLTIEPRPLAERLRIRKGDVARLTIFDGVTLEFEVTYVSMPDSDGRCEVRLTRKVSS